MDELTSLASTPLTDQKVGMYLIGESLPNGGGYARFTTGSTSNALKFPTWIVGANQPQPLNSCSTGSIFSCTSTAGNCVSPFKTLWGCAGGTWSLIK